MVLTIKLHSTHMHEPKRVFGLAFVGKNDIKISQF